MYAAPLPPNERPRSMPVEADPTYETPMDARAGQAVTRVLGDDDDDDRTNEQAEEVDDEVGS